MIKMILAMTEEGLIGNQGKLPWKIKEELEHFKKLTGSFDMIMGRKTFDSLAGKLPNRKHIVLSTKDEVKGADKLIKNEEELLELLKEYKDKDVFIIGGKTLFENYIQYASEVYVSVIKNKYEGDLFIKLNLEGFSKELYKENKEFAVYLYKK